MEEFPHGAKVYLPFSEEFYQGSAGRRNRFNSISLDLNRGDCNFRNSTPTDFHYGGIGRFNLPNREIREKRYGKNFI
jgi:hypothetical protein